MPGFVRDASKFLMVLIAKFHHAESTRYDRGDCLRHNPVIVRRLHLHLTVKARDTRHSPTDINKDAWWFEQLLAGPETFTPPKTPDWPLFDFEAAAVSDAL